jgi:GntR family transcriptional regulator
MSDAPSVEDLPISHPDESDSTPLYRQIEDDLRQMIATGVLAPGSTMPTELQLSQAYGVGRQTIRFALSRLVSDNLITRHAGRGTFVTEQSDRMKFYLDRSFTRQMEELGIEAHSKVLEVSSGIISEWSPEPLRDRLGAPCLNLVRLRLGGGEPIGIQATTLLTGDCPGIETTDFTAHSLYDVLATHYRLPIAQIHHAIGATAAGELQASLLQVARNAPLLVVNTTAFLENGEVIEYTSSTYRADKYEYRITHRYSPSP